MVYYKPFIPSLSGLQSRLTMGCDEITLELSSSTVPGTPKLIAKFSGAEEVPVT